MLREEPFFYARDSVEYKVHLMIWGTRGKERVVEVETFKNFQNATAMISSFTDEPEVIQF